MTWLTADEARRRIGYDPDTGDVFWKAEPPRGRKIGELLNTRDNGNGYIYTTVNRKHVAVHRLVWFIVYGQWPVEVDHISGDKADNRLANLREVTRSQNCMNLPKRSDNTSGFKGVGWHKCKGQWRAYIQKDGRHISLGYHPSPEAASQAYAAAAQKLFGEYARVDG